jgi:hypothetical protein
LKEYNINFDAHPAPRKVFLTIASNLLLPVIFYRKFNFPKFGEFFMVDNPMNLGKSHTI